MWEDAFREMKLPEGAKQFLSFIDGQPKVYTGERDKLVISNTR